MSVFKKERPPRFFLEKISRTKDPNTTFDQQRPKDKCAHLCITYVTTQTNNKQGY